MSDNASTKPAEKGAETGEQDPDGKGLDTTATFLATGLTILTAALGTFGTGTGAVARMARNYPLLTGFAVALVLFGVALAVVSRLIPSTAGKWRRRTIRLLVGAASCFAAGLILAMSVLIHSLGLEDRPSVSAQATRSDSGALTLTGTAKASGLGADDKVYVFVSSLDPDGNSDQIYYSVVGPNLDGVVDHSFSINLDVDVEVVIVTAAREKVEESCEPADSATENQLDPSEGSDALTPPSKLAACVLLSIGKTLATPPPIPDPPPTSTPPCVVQCCQCTHHNHHHRHGCDRH